VSDWFKRKGQRIKSVPAEERRVKTEGVYEKCPECKADLYKGDFEESLYVCRDCGHHFRIGARQRLAMLFDEGNYEELDADIVSHDPLEFVDTKPYKIRLEQARRNTGLPEAVINGRGRIGDFPVLVAAMDFSFLGGSMGLAVGEKITRLIERAMRERSCVVIVSQSGGARMQEGALSLMQMAKISAALAMLAEARLPYISVMSDPTTGGVTASFAMLGDLNVAEPKALIGFAGPRVIEQTIRQKLPENFQTAEFLLEHGMLDAVVDRRELRDWIIRALAFMYTPEVNPQLLKPELPFGNGTGTLPEQTPAEQAEKQEQQPEETSEVKG